MEEENKPLLYEKNQPSEVGYGPPLPSAQRFPSPPPAEAPPVYDGQQYSPAQVPTYQQPGPAYQQPGPAYQQPGPAYQQPAYQQPATVNQTVVMNTNNIRFGDVPMQMRCPSCNRDVITAIHYEPGVMTWIAVGVLFIIGFALCCWIPLFLDALKDVNHTCPNCHHRCGVYKRLEF